METRESWNTRVGLVLAMAGNAVGLGNFLRFPAQAAQNGGGAFLIPYLISFVLMGIPVLWVEWALGRYGGIRGYHSLPGILDSMAKKRWLKYLGVFGVFVPFAIAAYYCYIESWALAYVFHSALDTFSTTPAPEFFPRYLDQEGGGLLALPGQAILFFLVTLVINVYVLSRGVAKGIEVAAKICLPLLLLFGAILAIRGLTLPVDAAGVVESPLAGLNFVWEPQLSGLKNPTVWLAAAGQVFFTLSVGVGSIACYASYIGRNQDIALNAASAGWLNEFVEVVIGGSIMIPIATAYLGLAEVQAQTVGGSGFGLGFLTLPTLFNNWGWFAPIAGVMWFGLLFFAGITSSLAMGQPVMAFLEDEFGVSRRRAAFILGISIFGLGLFAICLYPIAFNEFDFWTGTFCLVVFAFLEVLIFGWVLGSERGWNELMRGADMKIPQIFRPIIRYVTPTFIGVVLLGAMIQPAGDWGQAIHGVVVGEGWELSANSVIGKILHVGTDYRWLDDEGEITPVLVEDATRLLLLLVFAVWIFLTWKAWERRRRKGREAKAGRLPHTTHGEGEDR